jgi:hypothetical protein
VEYAIDVDKRLLVLFESGEGVLHRGGRRVLRWKLLFEAQARGKHNTNSAAKPATAASADSVAGGKGTGRCRNTLRLFGMVGARSSCGLHSKATLSASIRVL